MKDNNKIFIITGNMGSGKTEFALQYAMQLKDLGKTVNIVDLDVINVYYRSRENIDFLKKNNIKLWGSVDFEYNATDLPALSFGFESLLNSKNNEYVVVDLAGSINGLKLLMALQNKDFEYELWLVCNIYREETDNEEKILSLIESYEKFSNFKITGIVNNSNLLKDTTVDDILAGQDILNRVSEKLHIPIIYTVLDKSLKNIEDKIVSNHTLTIDDYLSTQNKLKGGLK